MYLLHRKKNGIYANISLFLSYSEVTVATRSSPYTAQMVTAVTQIQSVSRSDGGSVPRDDLYSPERQRRPGHLDGHLFGLCRVPSHTHSPVWMCFCEEQQLIACNLPPIALPSVCGSQNVLDNCSQNCCAMY